MGNILVGKLTPHMCRDKTLENMTLCNSFKFINKFIYLCFFVHFTFSYVLIGYLSIYVHITCIICNFGALKVA